jgi:hypothetical protein
MRVRERQRLRFDFAGLLADEPGQIPVASLNLLAQYPLARGPRNLLTRDTQRVNEPERGA